MNRAEHTQGPWEWFYDGGGTYSIGQVPDAQANPPHITVWDRNHERASANCCLVAEAPELLRVAKAALEYIDALPEQLITMPGFDRDWADEIIAKAEGR